MTTLAKQLFKNQDEFYSESKIMYWIFNCKECRNFSTDDIPLCMYHLGDVNCTNCRRERNNLDCDMMVDDMVILCDYHNIIRDEKEYKINKQIILPALYSIDICNEKSSMKDHYFNNRLCEPYLLSTCVYNYL
jgi:hypothetical protein